MATRIRDMHPIEKLARDPRSPYWLDGDKPEPIKSVVVFVDLLGFTDRMREASPGPESILLLQRLRSALNDALIHLDPSSSDATGISTKRLWDYKSFTDNIVIGYPIRHAAEVALGSVFEQIGAFQLSMIQAGFFVRGGIDVGDLYMDRDIVYGPGLIDAYQVEQTIARDPRIALSPTAVDYVNEHLGYYKYPESSPQNRDLIRDADGQVFVNYLDWILVAEDDHGPFFDTLLDHKAAVERELLAHISKPRIWSKYFWAATYHNYFCSRRDALNTEEYRIDVSGFQPSMKALVE